MKDFLIKAFVIAIFGSVALFGGKSHAQLTPLAKPTQTQQPAEKQYVKRVEFKGGTYVGLRYIEDASCPMGRRAMIEFVAEYAQAELRAFEDMLIQANREADCLEKGKLITVGLASGGGLAYLGVRMGNLFNAYHVHAVAATCISSCSIAWFMAPSRGMLDKGEIGVHAPYLVKEEGKKNGANRVPPVIECALPTSDTGKWVKSTLRAHLGDLLNNDYKLADLIFDRMFAHCSATSADMISKDEAKRLGLI